ncbi:MAG: hypothetical protein V5804_03880 [Mucilaginibacter sp.]|uniref:hypothetical protein n=1 Tax=Mucilaginibacter sp. TaxID=1882438 RepID=UPI0034E3BC6B
MSNPNPLLPGSDENLDRDKKLKDDLGDRTDPDDLLYNAEKNSYEIDVKSEDPDYQHDFPYNTAAPNGEDFNSTYDEANPEAVDEYIPHETLATDVDSLDNLGMHIDNGQDIELDPIDEVLARTPEDDRDDLDEEGYPKNDRGIDAEGYPKKGAGDNDDQLFK